MKKFFILLALLLTVGIGDSQAQVQTPTDSWAFGFGLSFPRLYSVNITSLNSDYGAYLSLQRNFSENVGLRLKAGYSHMEGQWTNATFALVDETTNLITGDLDLLYYLVPCAPVSPYLYVGVGGNYKSIDNPQNSNPDSKFGSQLNAGVGAEFKLDPSWSLVTEFGYHMTNNSELDGAISPIEVNGRDSYIVLSAGFNFFFDQGEASEKCEPCQGITQEYKDMTDYDRIDKMIIAHIPKEVVKEVVVDKYIYEVAKDKLVLVGVNFAFDKADLLPESYPVLDKAVVLLNDRADARVEIQGYTDYVGTNTYNQQLSIDRAKTVKAYLVSKGIAENRLTAVGYGEGDPVGDNDTEEGRAMNRRIVFRILK